MWFLPPGLLRPSHGMAVYQKPARGKVESGKTAGPHRFCHVLLVRSKSQVSPALKEGELLGVTLVCINHNTVQHMETETAERSLQDHGKGRCHHQLFSRPTG